MNENLYNIKLSQIPPQYTRYDRIYTPASTLYTRKKMISWAHGLLRAVNSLKL